MSLSLADARIVTLFFAPQDMCNEFGQDQYQTGEPKSWPPLRLRLASLLDIDIGFILGRRHPLPTDFISLAYESGVRLSHVVRQRSIRTI